MDLVRGKRLSSFMSIALLASWSSVSLSRPSLVGDVVEGIEEGVHRLEDAVGLCHHEQSKKEKQNDVKLNSAPKTSSVTYIFGDIEAIEDLEKQMIKFAGDDVRIENDDFVLAPNVNILAVGDFTDRGNANKKITGRWLRAQKNYGADRVKWNLGNRDINKMRFNTELENDKFGPGKFRVPEFETKWKTCMANKLNTVDGVLIDYTDDLDKQTKRIIGLKCMADQTMGAGNLLRFMHEEAQTENDLQTYNETVGLVKEGGHVTQILQQGQLVHYDEHMKLLSIHGGLSVGSWLYLPGKKKQANSFKGWVSKLNKWGKKQVEAGLEGKYEESKDIVELQEPKVVNGSWQGTNPHSIIHGRPWNEEFNIASLSSNEAWDLKAQGHSEEVILQRLAERGIVDLAAEMKNSDVDMVACGHSPIGKRAMFIREWNGVLTIFGDTSAWNPASGSTIKTEKGRVQIFSTDKDESGNEILIVADSNDPEVGVQLPDGSWVVGKVVSTGERVCTKWTPAKANNGSNAGYGTPGKDTYLKAGETPSAVETFKIE